MWTSCLYPVEMSWKNHSDICPVDLIARRGSRKQVVKPQGYGSTETSNLADAFVYCVRTRHANALQPLAVLLLVLAGVSDLCCRDGVARHFCTPRAFRRDRHATSNRIGAEAPRSVVFAILEVSFRHFSMFSYKSCIRSIIERPISSHSTSLSTF